VSLIPLIDRKLNNIIFDDITKSNISQKNAKFTPSSWTWIDRDNNKSDKQINLIIGMMIIPNDTELQFVDRTKLLNFALKAQFGMKKF
jgi:hypothetical protein